jgi:NAD+ kinase
LLVITEPCAAITAADTMFSDAISSISSRWRPSSFSMAPKISGSRLSRVSVKKPSSRCGAFMAVTSSGAWQRLTHACMASRRVGKGWKAADGRLGRHLAVRGPPDAGIEFPMGAGNSQPRDRRTGGTRMPAARNIAFLASDTELAQEAKARLEGALRSLRAEEADVIVALGGDGFMLATLHATQEIEAPVYGMNRGTVGFLMNAYREDDLIARLEAAEEEVINPLHMWAERVDGSTHEALAINEVSLLRAGPQAAKLRIYVDGRLRMEELVCDGALVCTPAGSTAYNYSAHGPILPIGADVLAVTAVAAFRPRRWRGALLPKTAVVRLRGDRA